MMNKQLVLAGLVFAATWLLWSGMFKPLLLMLGLAAIVIVLVLAVRIGFFEPAMYTLHLLDKLPRYWLWLVPKIVQANLDVTRIVLSPRLPIAPCITTVDASHLPQVSQVVLANTITLTPGTLTLDIDKGQIEVHCLTRKAAEDIKTSAFLERAAELERN